MKKLPYKIWYEIAYHYAISQNAAGIFYGHMQRSAVHDAQHWKGQYLASFSKASAYHYVWRLLGGDPRTLEDWYEKMKGRWQKR